MTDTDDYTLEEALGQAASHENAAGWIGMQVQDKVGDYLEGSEIAQKYLPDIPGVQQHLNEYTDMLAQIGADVGNYASAELAHEYEAMVPDGDVSPEYGLAVAGFLEQEAERVAGVALDAAEQSDRGRYMRSRIEAIGGDEQGEAQEVRDALAANFDWNERDDVSFDDLTSVENVAALADQL